MYWYLLHFRPFNVWPKQTFWGVTLTCNFFICFDINRIRKFRIYSRILVYKVMLTLCIEIMERMWLQGWVRWTAEKCIIVPISLLFNVRDVKYRVSYLLFDKLWMIKVQFWLKLLVTYGVYNFWHQSLISIYFSQNYLWGGGKRCYIWLDIS